MDIGTTIGDSTPWKFSRLRLARLIICMYKLFSRYTTTAAIYFKSITAVVPKANQASIQRRFLFCKEDDQSSFARQLPHCSDFAGR